MIEGRVSANREAVISISVLGPGGATEIIDAIVDTGFNDYLTLPRLLVSKLNLSLAAPLKASLADGSVIAVDLFRASVVRDGSHRSILVVAAEGKPLVGMSMLYGFDLFVRAIDGGAVTITRPASP